MASLNRVLIIGNLGQDPELRYTQSGAAVCTLNVATNEVRTDKEGNRQDLTEWHRIVVFNKQAENCAKYLGKGRPVFVEGKIQTRSWDDKTTGQKRFSTEILAERVQFLGTKDQGMGASSSNYNNAPRYQDDHSGSQGNYGSSQQSGPSSDFGFGGPGTPDLDDIPF